MTATNTVLEPTVRSPDVAGSLRGAAMRVFAWWRLYRTLRILSGLDERTRKDIGFAAPGGAESSADPRVLRYLETLR